VKEIEVGLGAKERVEGDFGETRVGIILPFFPSFSFCERMNERECVSTVPLFPLEVAGPLQTDTGSVGRGQREKGRKGNSNKKK
jgi:hypothetical protein